MDNTTPISYLNLLESSFNQNNQLNFEIKSNLKFLSAKIVQYFPDLDWKEFAHRFSTLFIEKNLQVSEPGLMAEYYPTQNIIRVNPNALKDKSVDPDYLIGMQLVKMAFSHETYWGFNQTGEYKALNEGYASIIAQNIIGNLGEYVGEEYLLTNLVGIRVGNEAFLRAFKSGNPTPIKNRMIQQGMPESVFTGLNQKLNYNMENRMTRLTSSFPNLQLEVIQLLQSVRAFTKEEQRDIKLYAIGNPNLLYTPGVTYRGLEGTYRSLTQVLSQTKNYRPDSSLTETLEDNAKKVM